MRIEDAISKRIKPNDLKIIWENFSKEIHGKFYFNEPIRANINGPIYVYKIASTLNDYNLEINQTVYIRPLHTDQPTLLHYCLSKEINQNIIFRFWKRDFFEKLFSVNKIHSGQPEIDKNYSLQTNNKKLSTLFIKDKKIKEILMSSIYHLNIDTDNNKIAINLKRTGISNSINEFHKDYEILKTITTIIASL